MKAMPLALVTTVLLFACEASIVDHSFEFNTLEDSPGVRILNYRYGDTKHPGGGYTEEQIKLDQLAQRTGITGPMRRPESLYVKWLLLGENKVYEDTVDLRNRLPRDFTDCKVYFMVQGPQLYVYLINRGRRPLEYPPNGPSKFRDYPVLTLYPGQPNLKGFPPCPWERSR